ncbi:MAG: urease accessory protein [Saprospiraceae bacterium]|jgi:high-affinity nickel permease|nr:urease accessory protein [Saprospiraceae bacterium]
MESILPIFFAAVVGFSHSFEADHLLAVSNIVTKRNSIWLAVKDGIAWGLGHTSTIFVIGLLIIVFKVGIGEQVFHYLEAAVGLMLITLGVFRLYFLQKNGRAVHTHLHPEDLFFWKKKRPQSQVVAPFNFSGAPRSGFEAQHLQLDTGYKGHQLAYGVGLVHGLAGSGALVVLVMSQIQRIDLSILYLLIFGIGSVAGMLLASGLFSLPFSKKLSSHRWLQLGLALLSSVLCIGYGAMVVLENLGA